MSLNYCTVDDLIYKDLLQYQHFIGITIGTPIMEHNISGWFSLCGVFPNRQEKKLFDIWLGFNGEKFDDLCRSLGEFSKRTRVKIL